LFFFFFSGVYKRAQQMREFSGPTAAASLYPAYLIMPSAIDIHIEHANRDHITRPQGKRFEQSEWFLHIDAKPLPIPHPTVCSSLCRS